MVGGLLVGGMGWFVPQVLGVGYGFVGDALNGRMAFHLMLLLLVLKLFAVTTSYASGNAGGIFGPSLFLGAMLGGVVGTAAHHLFPLATATPGAYALVGMGAVFAGVVRTPMTSVLIIFEMTQDYAVIVPLMIANMVSLFVASLLQHGPIYEALAVQDGIHLPSARTRLHLEQHTVAEIMKAPGLLLESEISVREALGRIRAGGLDRPWSRTGAESSASSPSRRWRSKWTRTPAGCSTTSSPLPSFPTCTPIRGWTWPWSAWEATRSICCRWSAAPMYTRWSAS